MKLQINTLMLRSMGWEDNNPFFSKNIPVDAIIYFKSKDTVFYITCKEERLLFNKRTIEDLKHRYDSESPTTEIKSNADLFRLVIDNEAFEESYVRHFKINKLFKNE
jgi:hypothetical protein